MSLLRDSEMAIQVLKRKPVLNQTGFHAFFFDEAELCSGTGVCPCLQVFVPAVADQAKR